MLSLTICISESTTSLVSTDFLPSCTTPPEPVCASLASNEDSNESTSSNGSYDSDCSLSEDDDFMSMLLQMHNMDNDLAFGDQGYKKLEQISDTIQGDVCKAQVIDNGNFVAIRRTDKMLFDGKISVPDEDGFIYCVDDDFINEANVLKHLSTDKSPASKHVVGFVDFFESDTDFFLVTEYISSQMNLAQFIAHAKQHIDCGQLSMKQYQKTIHQLLQQLFVTMQWLHVSMKCCHLDLRLENILVENAVFIQTKEGMEIDENICIKLTNFGAAQLFLDGDFLCDTANYLNTDAYSAPNVFDDKVFDARCADNWRLGMIVFECVTVGNQIYEPSELNVVNRGHMAIINGLLESYLRQNHLCSQFNVHSLQILTGLLNANESERLNVTKALEMKWFKIKSPQIE